MDRIYKVLEEIQNGEKSPKKLFDKVGHLFKDNLVEYQFFLNDLSKEAFVRFLGGSDSPKYGDIILTDKGRGYLEDNKARLFQTSFTGPCETWGKLKCSEHFVTNIDELCTTCFLRTKIASVRANMIMKFETLKSINSKEYIIKYLKGKIEKANKKITDLINMESTGSAAYRENRVGMVLSYKDCLQYYYEQLSALEKTELIKRMSDTEFIQGKRTESFKTHVEPEKGIIEHHFEITKNGEIRRYTPYQYLDLILECHFQAIDKETDINMKISGIVNAKVIINRQIRTHGLNRFNYDFSNIFAEIDDTMFQLKSYKELGIGVINHTVIPAHENTPVTKENETTIQFEYANKEMYLYDDKIEDFKTVESELLQKGFITSKGEWNVEQNKLVALIHILYKLGYLKRATGRQKEKTLLRKYRDFFSKRYDKDITKAFQPSQFDISKLKTYKADYYFITEIDKI